MDFNEIIQKRRSIRKYNDTKVEFEKIKDIITAGSWAPTACNKQDFRFIYFDNNKMLTEISKLGSAHFLKNCNQAIMVLYDNRIDNVEYMDNIQSASAVTENMLLKAAELNIGTCWVCNLPPKRKLRKLLNIPNNYDPIALITLGYYDNVPKIMPRKNNLDDIIFINSFDKSKNPVDDQTHKFIWVRKYLRIIYSNMPKTKFIKKLASKFEKKFDN